MASCFAINKSWVKLIFAGLILVVGLLSCDVSSSKEIAEAEIEDLFTNIIINFSNGYQYLDDIIIHYDTEFLHSGMTIPDERNQWMLWLIDYNTLEIKDLDIEVIDDYHARANFVLTLSSATSEITITVPGDYDNISFFEVDSSDNNWKFIGNQLSE